MAERKDIDVLVLYGSASDKDSYDAVNRSLDAAGLSHKFLVCSAHRTPALLDRVLDTYRFKACVAGAGLAAHLPGVIASKTTRPVIGVPVDGNYDGLDSFLAIAQMPPGIPVLSIGVGQEDALGEQLRLFLSESRKIRIVKPGAEASNLVDKTEKVLKSFSADYEIEDGFSEACINIACIPLDADWDVPKNTIIVPFIEKPRASDAAEVLAKARSGLFVGVRRAENAAIAAVELQNVDGKHDSALDAHRQEQQEKIERMASLD